MNSVCQGLLLNVKESGTQVKDPNSSRNTETKQVENFLSDFAGVDEDYIRAKGSDNFYSVKENQFLSWTYYTQNDSVNSPASWREVVDVTGDAMSGCFNYNGKTALYVVNYDMIDAQTINLTLDGQHRVRMIQKSHSKFVKTDAPELHLEAGEGILLVID